MADAVLPKPTIADLEAKGVNAESLAVGAPMTVEQLYVRRYKSGKLGFGGKVRGSDGNIYQITSAVLIERA